MKTKRTDGQKRRTDDLTVLGRQGAKLELRSESSDQAEAEFTVFFTRSIDLQCIAGLDGRFKRLNPAWTTILGWDLEELEARPFLDFVHPEDHAATQAQVGKLAEGEETVLFENRYRGRDGSYRRLQWSAAAVPGRQRIYATARDVTARALAVGELGEASTSSLDSVGSELDEGGPTTGGSSPVEVGSASIREVDRRPRRR